MSEPDPSSHRREARDRDPKQQLSRARIAGAALEIGVGDLTVARVARHLRTTPGALYEYVRDRDDLLAAAVEHAFEAAPWPEATTWRGLLEAEIWIRWELFTGTPGLNGAMHALRRRIPASIQRAARLVEALCDLGFDEEDALVVVDTVVDLVAAGASQYAAVVSVSGDAFETFIADRRMYFGPDSEAVLRRVLGDPTAFFARKVELVLDGVEALAPEHKGPSREG